MVKVPDISLLTEHAFDMYYALAEWYEAMGWCHEVVEHGELLLRCRYCQEMHVYPQMIEHTDECVIEKAAALVAALEKR